MIDRVTDLSINLCWLGIFSFELRILSLQFSHLVNFYAISFYNVMDYDPLPWSNIIAIYHVNTKFLAHHRKILIVLQVFYTLWKIENDNRNMPF